MFEQLEATEWPSVFGAVAIAERIHLGAKKQSYSLALVGCNAPTRPALTLSQTSQGSIRQEATYWWSRDRAGSERHLSFSKLVKRPINRAPRWQHSRAFRAVGGRGQIEDRHSERWQHWCCAVGDFVELSGTKRARLNRALSCSSSSSSSS